MAESDRRRSEHEMRLFVRGDVERMLTHPASEWTQLNLAFLHVAEPYALDEALTVALEQRSGEGVGAIVMAAYVAGSDISRPGEQQDLEAAAQYAAVVDRVLTQGAE